MRKNGMHTLLDNSRSIVKRVEALTKQDVLVGIPAAKGPRDAGEPINNAALLYIHEHGAPEANIPARPALFPGVRDVRAKVAGYFSQATAAALSGKSGAPEKVERALIAAGTVAASAVKNRITAGPFAPLAPSTLAARRRRGRTGTRPLIDTGQMRNAVTFVLRKKGG